MKIELICCFKFFGFSIFSKNGGTFFLRLSSEHVEVIFLIKKLWFVFVPTIQMVTNDVTTDDGSTAMMSQLKTSVTSQYQLKWCHSNNSSHHNWWRHNLNVITINNISDVIMTSMTSQSQLKWRRHSIDESHKRSKLQS